ncbi:MAG TPA: VCBS repeat-containing protein [Puia sp.]|nr:VCBS repeat-containing protein [Puia sp.]
MKGSIFFLACLPASLLFSCHHQQPLFERISSSHSGITFTNTIIENDSINPMDVVNIYNGGGVGIGDFNNDGLPDIYFSGNMVPGKLYLNRGDFQFEDITDKAGVDGQGRWGRGVSVIDINNDGLMDIYICNTISKDSLQRRNLLYVNQGPDKDGIPHFKDMAAEYGLDIHLQSTMASFFDYDNDGDLDMYLTVNEAANGSNTTTFLQRNNRVMGPSFGRLYRNDRDSNLKHPVFHDVSAMAGIKFEGYGHAATICDINNDGWKDIYVSDDFLSSNILYINNHDGTFTNRLKDYFKHTSYNSMGQDVVDINNDGLPDVIELDMNPEDNYRKKMMLANNSYLTYQNFDLYGYQFQYVRNTLQLNQGPRIGENDSIGIPAFSETGFLSGIAQTDWSWAPLVADFDNDGYRDLVVTNGFPRDVSDHDFMAYRDQSKGMVDKKTMLEQIPQVKLHNYAFRNRGDGSFSDETKDWGLSLPTFSNGVAYADFDNDGAMDMVINNINDEALLYRNTLRGSRTKDRAATQFLQIKFRGDKDNIDGIGATVRIFYDHGRQQLYDNNPYRGYLSTMQGIAHFGLGRTTIVDSVRIEWYNGKRQSLQKVHTGQVITVSLADAKDSAAAPQPALAAGALFKEVTHADGISYRHHDYDFIDFDIQHLLPHKLSEYGPALAAGDIDGNGYDDLIIGGNGVYREHLLLQQPDGRFLEKEFLPAMDNKPKTTKDEGILLFDANGDGKMDVYIASGGYESRPGSDAYQDRLYINDGHGNFKRDSLALPVNYTSKFCVRAMDFNNDGKQDLFVSGRMEPWKYPTPVSSFFFRNDTRNGQVKFTDVTDEVAPGLKNIGMISDALFTDFDGDGQTDLIVVGEWMPVTFFKNIKGRFVDVTPTSGIGGQPGWWNAIVAGDFRHTGRTDYIVGNTGLNTLYQASEQYPVYITAKDFDNNGAYIGITSLFLPDRHGEEKEFPASGRDDIARQLPSIKKRFATYKPFALATMDEVLTPGQWQGALRLKATMLQSCYLRNDGAGKFSLIPLPKEAQVSVVNGMVADDFDGDGNLDVLINGNDYGTEVGIGRYDAFNGLLLRGDGAGGFAPLSMLQSGIYIPGNGKALVKLRGSSGAYLIAASQNKDDLKLYEGRAKASGIPVGPDDVSALIRLKDGRIQKEEFYYGNSFLSQSARFIRVDSNVAGITIKDSRGNSRMVTLPVSPVNSHPK